MKLDKILKEKHIEYKKIEYDKPCNIYKIKNLNKMVVCMEKEDNNFLIDNDLYYYLSNNKEEYSFILENKLDHKLYYLENKEISLFLQRSFNHTDKEEIYFGNMILDNEVNKFEVLSKIL